MGSQVLLCAIPANLSLEILEEVWPEVCRDHFEFVNLSLERWIAFERRFNNWE